MNPELRFKCRVLLLCIWPYSWLSAMISCFLSTMPQASCLRLIYLQLKWASSKIGVAQPLRGKTPKLKVLKPKINTLGPKSFFLLALASSVARKATEPQTAGRGVNCSLCMHLQAKAAVKVKIQFPNRETDDAKGCLWLLSWFWLGVCS